MSYPVTRPLVPWWSPTPIPNLSLSAGGLLALADLNTIAQRTVIAGGSSWLDALVLAPGLHYQQAADALDRKVDNDVTAAIEARDGGVQVRYVISNTAFVNFLRRLWREVNQTDTMTLDVAMPRDGGKKRDMEVLGRRLSKLVRGRPPSPNSSLPPPPVEMDWLSHVLYLLSPLLTSAAILFMVLLGDWWGLSFIISLMLSRILNIWSIKQRSRPEPEHRGRAHTPCREHDDDDDNQADGDCDDRLTEYAIDLGDGRRAVLRGLSSDLQAVTTKTWLRAKTNLDDFLEAAAKLLVYLVAAFSGNLSQAGAIVLMALLLISAGLLGLSNAHARGLQMNGRVARLQMQQAILKREAAERFHTGGESGSMTGRTTEHLL
ncbi:hypothetical protein HIM_04672 [Hirsutella minnesotensis 3608]|uniref:Uncharacterized protein n=1 Tax=Hirsutella minnesotensis 3608 TaxID=1043627 RepID=A0A0F7ZV20_9HYPO|nr:hypothetical protein HIM_04672 [Hirsutella minnesotensis 3608]